MIIGAVTLILAMTADLRPGFAIDSERVEFTEACNYYEMRAKSARASRPGEFVVLLADACRKARVSLDSGTRRQRSRSAHLLSQIALLRHTIDQMNADRAISAITLGPTGLSTSVASGTANGVGRSRISMVNPVSPTGEFLIAHRMGLMLAYEAWLDSGVSFSLGSLR